MLEASAAEDIVYSSLFTGVHGNYLKPSIKNAGLDPDNLPDADKSSMNLKKLCTKIISDLIVGML